MILILNFTDAITHAITHTNHIHFIIGEFCDPHSDTAGIKLSIEKKPEQNSGLGRIQTNNLLITRAMLYPVNFQATWIDGQL